MNRKYTVPSGVGVISLLMCLMVISFAVFAVLSFSGALGNRHYAERLAEHNRAYYAASNIATERLVMVDALLTGNPELTLPQLAAAVPGAEITELPSGEAGLTIVVPMTESECVQVILKIENGNAKPLFWHKIGGMDWNADESLHLSR